MNPAYAWNSLILALALPASLGAQSVLWNGVEPGPYAVGFRTAWTFDGERSFRGGASETAPRRALRMDIWYPTNDPGSLSPFEVYLARDRVPSPARRAEELVEAYDRWSYAQMSASDEPPPRLMETKTAVTRGAPPAPGPFPLIVYVGGWYSRSSDNTVLAEILASRGFVVVSTPHLDRGLWEYDFSLDSGTLETRVLDVEAVLRTAVRLPDVDADRVATGGYSTGGIVALVVAGRDPSIDACFGLDPAYLYEDRHTLEASGLLSVDDVTVPVLTLHSGHPDWTGRARPDLLDALTVADRWVSAIPSATHGDFSDDVMIEAALGLVPNKARSTRAGRAAFRAWSRLLTVFLEGALEVESDAGPGRRLEREAAVLDVPLWHESPTESPGDARRGGAFIR